MFLTDTRSPSPQTFRGNSLNPVFDFDPELTGGSLDALINSFGALGQGGNGIFYSGIPHSAQDGSGIFYSGIPHSAQDGSGILSGKRGKITKGSILKKSPPPSKGKSRPKISISSNELIGSGLDFY